MVRGVEILEDIENIPRIIHYCWFGRGPKPKKVVACMKSWKKHLDGYTFMEWNEDNFDLNAIPYVQEAYEARKYAFVSDVARLHALKTFGGIYLDTDVEVIKPLDGLLKHEAFSGFEDEVYLQSGTMGAVKDHPWITELLNYYNNKTFIKPDGTYDQTTNTNVITKLCMKHGLQQNGEYQQLQNGVVFYPRTYFSPYDYINGGRYFTDQTYTVHHYAQSWLPASTRYRSNVKRVVSRILGPNVIAYMRKAIQSKWMS